MTSIFNTSFRANLQRVLGGDKRNESIQDRSSRGKEEFASVLADLEKRSPRLAPDNAAPRSTKADLGNSDKSAPKNVTAGDKSVSDQGDSATKDGYLTSNDAVYALTRRANALLECPQNETLVTNSLGTTAVNIPTPAFPSGMPAVTPVSLKSPPVPLNNALNPLVLNFGEETEAPEAPVIKSLERVSMRVPSTSVKSPINYKRNEIEGIISTAGRFHGIDPTLSKAVAQAESSFRTDAVSKDGHASKGIFQLLDSTAKDLVGRFNFKEQYDPFDPAQNAYLGVGYLRRLHDIFSSETNLGSNLKTVPVNSADDLEKVALAAFNAGEGNVASAQRAAERSGKDPTKFENISPYLPPSTRAYVERVTQFRVQFAQAEGGDEIV